MTRYRFVGDHVDNLEPDGRQVEPGKFCTLTDAEIGANQRLIDDGKLIAAPETAEKTPAKTKEREQ